MSTTLILLLLTALNNVGSVASQTTTTILNVIGAETDLSGLTQLVTLLGLDDNLNTTDGATLFAPVNTAFATIDSKFLSAEWGLHLSNLVSNHILVPAVLTSTDLSDGLTVTSAVAENYTISVVDDSSIVTLNGDNFGTSTITEPDLIADNGVVHKVDTLLLSNAVTDDLIEVLEGVDGNPFSIFLTLLEITELADSLRTSDQTVLVPVDPVFEALDPIIIATLTDPANAALTTEILQNHIIPGPTIYPSTQLLTEPTLTTALGEELTVVTTDATDPMVLFTTPGGNTATGFALDGLGANGVVHAIDMILFPTDFNFPTESPAPVSAAPITAAPTFTTPLSDPTVAPAVVTSFPTPSTTTSDEPTFVFVPAPSFAPISMPPVLKLPKDDLVQIFATKCVVKIDDPFVVEPPIPSPPSGKGGKGKGGMSGMSGRRELVDVEGGRFLLDDFCEAIDFYCASLGGSGKGGKDGMSGMSGGRRDLTESLSPDLCDKLVGPTGKGKGGMSGMGGMNGMSGMSGMSMSGMSMGGMSMSGTSMGGMSMSGTSTGGKGKGKGV